MFPMIMMCDDPKAANILALNNPSIQGLFLWLFILSPLLSIFQIMYGINKGNAFIVFSTLVYIPILSLFVFKYRF